MLVHRTRWNLGHTEVKPENNKSRIHDKHFVITQIAEMKAQIARLVN